MAKNQSSAVDLTGFWFTTQSLNDLLGASCSTVFG